MGHPHLVVHIAPPDLVVLGYLHAFDGLLCAFGCLFGSLPFMLCTLPRCLHMLCLGHEHILEAIDDLHALHRRWMSVLIPEYVSRIIHLK